MQRGECVRPYFQTGIVELERLVSAHQTDRAVLEVISAELAHRKTDRAAALRAKVDTALKSHGGSRGKEPDKPAAQNARRPSPARPAAVDTNDLFEEREKLDSDDVETVSGTPAQPTTSFKAQPTGPLTNEPVNILAAWTVLEVLSPATYLRPAQLAGGDARAIAKLSGALPWSGDGEKSRPGKRLFYHVVLGSIDMAPAVDRLSKAYVDLRVERPQARGESIVASIIVDRQGRPIEESAFSISSFAWGLPIALGGDLKGLANWPDQERQLIEQLDKRVRRRNADGETLSLTRKDIDDAYKWLASCLGLPKELTSGPSFAVRVYPYYRSNEPPDALLLNSFFLNDLSKAAALMRDGSAPGNLSRYLGAIKPSARDDLLHDDTALARAVEPARFPPARWPSRGGHPLVLLQQAAVNLALDELRDGGVLAINGPPGTGKTTLLRDLVSGLVTDRAFAMAQFYDPSEAFVHSGEKVRAGNSWIHLYEVDESIRGFEMLVASSNNKAVENVSGEIPTLGAIADDQPTLRYFRSLSDELCGQATWGLGAAVLGNGGNRSRFRQTFWWDAEVGLSTYLAAASGAPQVIEETAEVDAALAERPPRIVTEEDAPASNADALRRWRVIREAFLSCHRAMQDELAELERVRVAWSLFPGFLRELADWKAIVAQRPGFWSRLFGTRRWREWVVRKDSAGSRLHRHTDEAEAANVVAREAANTIRYELERAREPQSGWAAAVHTLSETLTRAQARRAEIGDRFIDAEFFSRSHADRHRASPWLSTELQKRRDDLFVQALAVHKAFIDASAKPLRHNLGAMMNALGGGSLGSPEKDALLPHLWSSLFLVVPAISTTFASVDRMLGRLPPESLGWLLIDEAGQATPQSAVGALMRAKRAIVVGDPLQIQPVVMLPETLTDAIHRQFGADPDLYNAPGASVQTLADAATAYVAEFAGRNGSRTVGVPLLVHRRCSEPMFSVANAIAYERQMVQAKAPKESAIRDALGASRWINVNGRAVDKWSAAEGQVVLDLLATATAGGGLPDLYIVTPFVVVQDNLRRLIAESGILGGVVQDVTAWLRERVGTVHTVQGREAEAVIFVLGAPMASQTGARAWAGRQPNLLNVAVTRAKEAVYVVGSRDRWKDVGVFAELHRRLPE
jgi:hypothetical protein